jgi:hypothetical protein
MYYLPKFTYFYFQTKLASSDMHLCLHGLISSVYRNITIASEGLQNLGLCSTLRVFEVGEPTLTVTRDLGFSSLTLPQLVVFYDTQGDADDLF